ncbi:MAG: hypothetical protein QME96_10805, partial [Myxococcota bacterium]|nr:hypothetical protein [Myxococcota bacterium]
MRRAAMKGAHSACWTVRILLGACWAVLVGSCDGSSVGGDGATDIGEEDVAEVDAVEPPACEVFASGEPIAALPCRSDTCFRPHLSLGGNHDHFLVAYSKNVAWWSTDVFARLIAPDGVPSGPEINVSGRTDPGRSAPMRASSEYPFALRWRSGWLVTWEDRLTTLVFIAAAALDAAGETIWTGSRWMSSTTGEPFTW